MSALLPQPKTISMHGDERIILNHQGDYYRAARYHHLRLKSGKSEPTRTTATANKLEHLFCALFTKEYPDTRVLELIDYVHSTEWGAELP
jgi:hypothetical protein